MSRSLAAALGSVVVLLFAACSPDQASDRTLTPTDPLMAPGGGGGGNSPLCSGNLASDIAKDQKLLFLDATDLDEMDDAFTVIKGACPIVESDPVELGYLLDYYALMIANRTADNAAGLATHLFKVSQYGTGTGLVRSTNVFGALGGAGVVAAGGDVVSFDKGARLLFDESTTAVTQAGTVPFGRRLITFDPLTAEQCGDITGLRTNSRGAGAPCYDIQDYPDAVEYNPDATLTLCMHKHAGDNVGIVHERAGYGDEVLPRVDVTYFCTDFHASSSNGWLEQQGPLGRALARAYDFFAPKALIADDVGESGSIGAFSKVGGVLNDIFEDDFNDPLSFNPDPGADQPDLGDANTNWIYNAQSPGYIRIDDALGGLSGGVLVLSQGQGACKNCPIFRLLGEIRTVDEPIAGTNETDFETNGSFDVIWTSVQTKPSVKEAPFVLLNGSTGSDAAREIVRLSYVSQSSQNQLLLKIPGSGNSVTTVNVGSWVQNVSQTFKITLNLNVLNNALDNTVSLAIFDPATNEFVPVAGAQNLAAPRATGGFKHIGYVLTGIDAGILGSDDWLVTRLPDIPPS